jgi:hypothetical protein
MKQFIASATINGNEIQLVKERNGYFIHWGESSTDSRTETELLTLKENPVKESDAIKKFLEAVEASKYLTFSKL